MDAVLEQIVVDRLAASELAEAPSDLVLAACGGATELEEVIGGDAPHRTEGSPQLALTERDLGVYLAGLEVQGFRGVGARVELPLRAGPGLTIVVGRNGSGKSSFAEGLELLMTGANSRWANRTKVWTEGWQNLHFDGDTVLEARLQVEGEPGFTRLKRTWAPNSLFTPGGDCDATAGDGTATTLDDLGWTAALARYRPFLSFNELGSMFEKQGTMYEALSAILGLEDVDAIGETLRQARLSREKGAKASREETKAILPLLAGVSDPRARAAEEALAANPADTDAVELAVAGVGDEVGGDLVVLRALAAFAVATEEDVDAAISDLEAAEARAVALADTEAGRAASLSALLTAALSHHRDHRADDCPVCGTERVLTDEWRSRAVREITHLDQRAQEADQATREAAEARRRVGDLVAPEPPPAVAHARDLGLDPAELELAWERWQDERDRLDDPALLVRLRVTLGRLRSAAEGLAAAAGEELDRREDAWRPVAQRLAAWLPGARAAEADRETVKDLKAAEEWVKRTAVDLRATRLAPIEDAARANWQLLRQESNVSLGGFRLVKAGNVRAAEVEVRVDGSDASAFGVMSQGELHALAVSVFLPRAGLDESPFRFMVIDDPVQSMDPAKVDGLARALARAAERRQVVVFTHDERLTEAARRLGLDATVLEVTRQPGSVVGIRESRDPVERHLDDARALARSEDVPREVADRVIPGLCRSALEAACSQVVRRRRLGRGDAHAAIDSDLASAQTLYGQLSLALFDDPGKGSDVVRAVNNRWGDGAVRAVRDANRGVHETLDDDPRDVVTRAAVLARQLAETR